MKVLDASALLCFLQGEKGAELVASAFQEGCILSAVNFAEVLKKLADHGNKPAESYKLLFDNFVVGEVIKIIPFSQLDAKIAVELYTETKKYGLSSADRACLSLARQTKCRVLTTDKVWGKLNIGIDIEVLR